jgi:hypothetical protein
MSKNRFEIEGKFLRIDVRESKGREYKTLVLDVEGGNYPQVVPIRLWGQTNEESTAWKPGDILSITGRLGGRSWNDKVFGDITADTVDVIAAGKGETKTGEGTQGAVPQADDSMDVPF